jgi:hypothetical protein
MMRIFCLGLAIVALQLEPSDGRDITTFKSRVATLEARQRERMEAASLELRGQTTLAWLEALKAVVSSIPFERTDEPLIRAWLEANHMLVIYSEPAGEWLIGSDVLWALHDEYRDTTAADGIAWLAALNGLPGECEGYVPCYVVSLDRLYGEYLRRHPTGRYASDALARITESLTHTVDGLLRDPKAGVSLNVPDDCLDLLAGVVPLRRAIANLSGDTARSPLSTMDRLAASCPQ